MLKLIPSILLQSTSMDYIIKVINLTNMVKMSQVNVIVVRKAIVHLITANRQEMFVTKEKISTGKL